MNIRLLSIALAGALLASGAPALAHETKAATIEIWTNDTATQYSATSPQVVYVEQTPGVAYLESTPRVMYLDGMTRLYDADGNRVYRRDVYLNNWSNRSDLLDPSGRGMSPAEVSNLTHNVDSTMSGVPWSGAGVQAGNMGPANSKGQ